MSINRIYKGNRFILGFTDSEIRRNFLPISVNNDKLSCTCSNSRFNGAFIINHQNGGHTINIDWNRIFMTRPVEAFDLYIKYDGNIRITESIRIEYPLSNVRFNIHLSKEIGLWGTQPNCVLNITPSHSTSDAWQYKDQLVKVSFQRGKENCFFPDNDVSEFSFRAKEGIAIPLKFIFKPSPLMSKERFYVVFAIAGEAKCIPFEFEPIPVDQSSYDIFIERLVKEFEYGTHNKPLFELEVITANDYVSPAKIAEVSFSNAAPFFHRLDNGRHLVYIDVSALRWMDFDKKYNVQITLDNSLRFSKEVLLCAKDCSKSNSVSLKPGQGPILRLLPNNSVDIYEDEKREVGLEVENKLSSPLTITEISSNDSSYNYNGKVFELDGGAKKIIPVIVKGAKNKTITYRLYTKEANVVKVSLGVRVRKKEDIKIHPKFILKENYKLIVKEGYDCNEICGSIVVDTKNHSSHNNPFVLEEFKLQSGDFYIESSNVNNDNCYCFSIGVKKGAFSDFKSISVDENGYYPLSWNYHNQKGVVLVPLLKPVHYKLSYPQVCTVDFPRPDECRQMELCTIGVSEQTNELFVLDDDQEISVSSPFFMLYNDEVIQRVALTEPTNITLCVNIDNLGQVCLGALNIDRAIEIQTSIICNSRRRGESSKLFKLLMHPISEDPKPKIFFVSDNNEETPFGSKKQIDINLFEQPEDVMAMFLGSICFRNAARIPCKGKGLRCHVKSLKAEVGNRNLLHEDTTKYIGSNIEILNGEADFLIPVFVDYQLWKSLPHNEQVHLFVEIEDEFVGEKQLPRSTCFEMLLKVTHLFVDDVYALDLGTTGIVVAKERDGEQEIVVLDDDEQDPIESKPEIISSHTMLIANEGDIKGEIMLSPAGVDYYGKTDVKRYRLVPCKFIIGQEKIPFLKDFYNDDSLCKEVKLFGLNQSEIDLSYTNDKDKNQKVVSSIIASLYRGIFKRFSKEANQIKKLVITYPNTYTIENLESIKAILSGELGLSMNGQITFVPESDAVAAYYFDQKIMNEGGFFDENGILKTEENVVFYDMGAGTLDLSLVSFKQIESGVIIASIVNKIGVPLAGNYLGYIIYKTLKDKGKLKTPDDIMENTINDLVEGIKCDYKLSDESIRSINPNWYSAEQDELNISDTDTYRSIFEDSLNDFLVCCSDTVFKLLIPKGEKVDTLVFSGRASQFCLLHERVVKSLSTMNGEPIKVDKLSPMCNCGDYLKTCVAIGALKYQYFFNGNDAFKIENKNIYSKIAVVYWGKSKGKFGVRVNFLVDPLSENWNDAELINGTWCKEFCASLSISDHLPGKKVYYIQTCLDESHIQDLFKKIYLNDPSSRDDLNWAFVNILFKKRIVDTKPFAISLRISKDNKILDRRIGSALLLDMKMLENVEDNILYKRSMWPFITKLDKNEY